jgi:hypothetical protein
MNSKRKWVFAQCKETALWEGLDSAIIGIAERCGQDPVVVYDYDRVLTHLKKQMSIEDAEEWIRYNIVGAWIGPLTPLMMTRIPPRVRLKQTLDEMVSSTVEVERLRDALRQIAENNDEPYARDFAKDILERRES